MLRLLLLLLPLLRALAACPFVCAAAARHTSLKPALHTPQHGLDLLGLLHTKPHCPNMGLYSTPYIHTGLT
jgi:hypothetical protein